jgi:hypothetical protein
MNLNFIINNRIIINEDDELHIRIEKYIVKYHRVIGLILLLIFLLILYCHYGVLKIKNVQNGGGPVAAVAAAPAALALAPGAAGAAGAMGSSAQMALLAQSINTTKIGVDKTMMDKVKGLYSKGKQGAESGFGSIKDYGRRSMSAIKSYSPIFYRMLYTVAFTLIVAIVVLPSVAFLIIGVICYFLLQKNMDYIKKL